MKIDEYSFFKLCGDMYERFSFEQNPQLYIHLKPVLMPLLVILFEYSYGESAIKCRLI